MEISKRNTALDVLRGITVAAMILVNNPGGPERFAPLRHAPWTGCTPTDLVFPFFLLCNGAAMAFSFSKYGNTLNSGSIFKVLKRGAALFLVGLLLNMVPTNWQGAGYWISHVRIMGILQRIALCYVLGGILALGLRTPKKILCGVAAVTILHWLLLRSLGGEGWATLEGNIGRSIDLAVLGADHLYQGYGIPFDPEGLFGSISGSGTLLIGYYAGLLLKDAPKRESNVLKLFAVSGICLALSQIWSIFLPISKPMWTGSYVLFSGGWAIYMLCFLTWLIDMRGHGRWCTPFKALGRNPLFAFVMAGLIVKVFGRIIHWTNAAGDTVTPLSWFYGNVCVPVCSGDNEFSSLLYALCLVALFTLMAKALYRRNIVIRL